MYWSGVVTLFPRVKDLWCLGMLIQTRHARLVTFVLGLNLIMMAILSYCQGSEFSDYSDFLLHVTVLVLYPGSQTSILTISNQNSNEKFSLQLALMPTGCGAPSTRCRYVKCLEWFCQIPYLIIQLLPTDRWMIKCSRTLFADGFELDN